MVEVFTDLNIWMGIRKVMVAMHWENFFRHAVAKYNSIYKVQLPKITPHIARHTFCSRMAAARMNPKTLQYIMGHSDIGITLNTYTHMGFEDASEEMSQIDKTGTAIRSIS